MTVFSTIFLITFLFYIILGLFILYENWHSKLHHDFFYICLCFAFWTFCHVFIFSTLNIEIRTFWTKMLYAVYPSYSIFTMKFFLRLSKLYKVKWIKRLFLSTIWILPGIFIYISLSSNAIAKAFPYGFWFILCFYTNMVYNLINTVLIIIWRIKTKSKREKKQAFLLFIFGVLAIFISSAVDYYAGFLGFVPSLAPITALIWLICVVYVIIRYRFLRLTPSLIGNEILNTIDEFVLLIDNNENVIFINKRGNDIFKKNIVNLDDLTNHIVDFSLFKESIKAFFNNNQNVFFNRIFLKKDDERIPFDINIKVVMDKFDDILGVLIIGKEVAGVGYLKKHFNLTSRQADIILYLVSGLTNKDISDKLNIAETTIKGHVTNIYNKMGISNRIELQNLLLNFNVKLPKPLEHSSLLITNK